MILSNETRYYKKNYFGIRIKILLYVRQLKNKLFFENLTLAPIEKDLINYKLLNKINTGKKIDIKARKFLKKDDKDYAHGTGHGVGFFLNVHEGPQSISKYNNIKIEKGMILSNEPGYYKENHFGIRIENLVYAQKLKKKLSFENLTLVPIEKDLINYQLLDEYEKDYLFRYHLKIYYEYSDSLNKKERMWLASLI